MMRLRPCARRIVRTILGYFGRVQQHPLLLLRLSCFHRCTSMVYAESNALWMSEEEFPWCGGGMSLGSNSSAEGEQRRSSEGRVDLVNGIGIIQ